MKESERKLNRVYESIRFLIKDEDCGTAGRRQKRKNTVEWGKEMKRLNVYIYHNFQRNRTVYC